MSNRGERPCWSNSSVPANDPSCTQRPQVSVFYFVTTVVGMVVLALFTLLFLFCLFLKRRRIQLRLNPRTPRSEMRAFETAVTFYPANEATLPITNPPGTSNANNTAAKGNEGAAAPFTCVIMAGESQPTFIAHPIPKTTSSTSTTTTTPVDQDADRQSSSQASNAEVKS